MTGLLSRTTTIRLSEQLLRDAQIAANNESISFNSLLVRAVEREMARIDREVTDAAFAEMAEDREYQNMSIELANEFR